MRPSFFFLLIFKFERRRRRSWSGSWALPLIFFIGGFVCSFADLEIVVSSVQRWSLYTNRKRLGWFGRSYMLWSHRVFASLESTS